MLTQEGLKKVLHYNFRTGIFTWIGDRKYQIKHDGPAGGKGAEGYITISIDKKAYKAHRLAWLYTKGFFPENDLDHKNRVRHDNRISNLREATRQCNTRNTGNFKNNNSGVKGVHWCNTHRKWCSQVMVNGKTANLGRYNDFDSAVCARLAAEQCLNWSGCDSSSPAFKYVQNMMATIFNQF